MTTQPQLRVVGTCEAPPPLLPPDVDLSDLREVLLNIQWMCDSRFSFTTSPEEFGAAVRLHARSIHERPAASLPEDDAELAFLAGFGRDMAGWKRVKDRALEGWTLCSDGRLYRRDMAVKVLDIWIKTLGMRRKSAAGVAKRKRVDFNAEPYDRPLAAAIDALYSLDPQAPVLRNHMNASPDIEADEDARSSTSGSTSGQTPGSTKGKEPKGTDPSEYISPTADAVGAGQPGQDSGACEPQPASVERVGRFQPWNVAETFPLFWPAYPLKTGKMDAEAAFAEIAAKPPMAFEDFLAALMRYRTNKPPSHDWAYPATWIRKGRWMDEFPDRPTPEGGGHRRRGGAVPPFGGGRKPFQPTSYRGRG